MLSHADTLTVGTPGDSYLATPTAPSPTLATIINFDNLTPGTSPVSSLTVGTTTFSSPDGLMVIPYSTQSGPNELFDASSNGTANLTIKLGSGAQQVGVGVADSDGVSITLQALNASGGALGSAFVESLNITQDPNNPGNSYFVISDTGSDIYGLSIVQSAGSANYSGLAIDDVGYATPEPAAFGLLGLGLAVFGGLRFRKKP
jgi:hypothetical protein